jgi:outer membrane murein-binding lipoprotein Lpp
MRIRASVLATIAAAACLAGCEDPELQKDVTALLEVANRVSTASAAVRAKDEGGENLQARIAFLERQLQVATQKAERANQRLSEMRLVGGEETTGEAYGCGGRDTQDAPFVMVGLRAGSGCGSQNVNYYRKLALSIPPP